VEDIVAVCIGHVGLQIWMELGKGEERGGRGERGEGRGER
jgi:hypothetical protein